MKPPVVTPVAPSAGDLQSFIADLGDVLEHQLNTIPASTRAELGIGNISSEPSVKVIQGAVALVNQGGFWLAVGTFDNANNARETFRKTLRPGEKAYLLFRYQGAGQFKTFRVKSPNDKPMDWNPDTMFIEPVQGLRPSAQRTYVKAVADFQVSYRKLESEWLAKPAAPSQPSDPPRPVAPEPVKPEHCASRNGCRTDM